MDMQGEIVHTWQAEFADLFPDHPHAQPDASPKRDFGRVTRLLPDGELIAVWELYGIFKLDRDSRIL